MAFPTDGETLAFNVLRSPDTGIAVGRIASESAGKMFVQAVITNIVNPKSALFFGRIGDWLSRHPGVRRFRRWLTASVLGGLALHLAVAARR